jgi:proteasome lid subunit RPN8/RPN11
MSAAVEHSFYLAGADWDLKLSEPAIAVLSRHAQRRWFQRESVGQLFASDLTSRTIVVDAATVLQPKRSAWASVTLDSDEAQAQREMLFREGMHCVGLWHTHPEGNPSPSGTDARLAADHAQAAKPVLNGLVFAIVGNRPFPMGWYIGVHDGDRFHVAERRPILSGTRCTPS